MFLIILLISNFYTKKIAKKILIEQIINRIVLIIQVELLVKKLKF